MLCLEPLFDPWPSVIIESVAGCTGYDHGLRESVMIRISSPAFILTNCPEDAGRNAGKWGGLVTDLVFHSLTHHVSLCAANLDPAMRRRNLHVNPTISPDHAGRAPARFLSEL